ncbi:MAG: cupin domain-containing protein [Clostridia bacterium]
MEPQGIYLYLTDENMNKRIPFKTFKICGEHVQPEHSHEYLQMWYVLKGRCTHFLNGHRYEYSRFGLFIIPPYATHHVETRDSDTELICCEFSERFINEALMDENRSGLFDFAYLEPFFLSENLIDTTHRIASDSAPEVEKLFLEIYDMFESLSKYARLL